jgi:hypothetical protein
MFPTLMTARVSKASTRIIKYCDHIASGHPVFQTVIRHRNALPRASRLVQENGDIRLQLLNWRHLLRDVERAL